MKKKILFRVDGNSEIGAGHIMRCLSIGEMAKNMGAECVYLTADHSFELLIKKNGFQCNVLDTIFSNPESEFSALEPILTQFSPDFIVVDSYYVTPYYLEWLKQVGKIIYIDDIPSFAYPVDILINYNIYADKKEYELIYSKDKKSLPHLILGPQYVPLRKEFQSVNVLVTKKYAENILVSVGGTDPEHMALKLLNSFLNEKEQFENYQFHFIINSFEPDRDEILGIASFNPWITIHENIQCMSALMLKCDLAIAAAGSTLYELSVCGVPTITYILDDNQVLGAMKFEALGIMSNMGDCRTKVDFYQSLCNEIKKLSKDENRRKQMKERGLRQIGRKGAEQLIKEIIGGFGNVSI